MENNLNNPEETTRRNNTSTVIDNFTNDPSNDTKVENHDITQFDTNYNKEHLDEISTHQEELKAAAKKDMLVGGLWLFGGLAVTFISYSAASGGGRYVMAWGAVIFGGFQFIRGLINYSK